MHLLLLLPWLVPAMSNSCSDEIGKLRAMVVEMKTSLENQQIELEQQKSETALLRDELPNSITQALRDLPYIMHSESVNLEPQGNAMTQFF